MYNAYIYREQVLDERIPIVVLYIALDDSGMIKSPALFCDTYSKNVAKIKLPIFNTINLYNIAYTKPIIFVDSMKDMNHIHNTIPECTLIVLNDTNLSIPSIDNTYNFIVDNNTSLDNLIDFMQKLGE